MKKKQKNKSIVIKNVSDLPRWFDLKKYTQTAKLSSAMWWYEQLIIRHTLLMVFDDPTLFVGEKEPGRRRPEDKKTAQKILNEIWREPMLNLGFGYTSYTCRVSKIDRGRLFAIKNGKPFAQTESGVIPLNMEMFKDLQWEVNAIDKEKCIDSFDAITNWTGGRFYNCDLLRVDLSLPDKLLKKEFAFYLEAKRAHINTATSIEEISLYKIERWIAYKILPYWDLRLWEKETGIHIQENVYADAIGDCSLGTWEHTRKPLAEQALTIKNLRTLAAMAASEA